MSGMQPPGWCGVGCRGAAPSDSSAQLGGLFARAVRVRGAHVLGSGALWLWWVLCGCGTCCLCCAFVSVDLSPAVSVVSISVSVSVGLGRLDLSRLDLESP